MPTNIGNPTEMTIKQFGEAVLRITGAKSKFVFHPLPQDDPKVRRPDITKARRVLGWEPKIALDEGLRRTADYFRTRVQRG